MKISLALVTLALLAGCRADLELVKVKDNLARCLDGSPAAYYIRPATSRANQDKWVLSIQGGSWCSTPEQCLERTKLPTGSSNLMPKTKKVGGALSEDAKENPDFYSWNHVLFAYCDGASFTGDVDMPEVVNGTKLYYRGYRNFLAIMNDLLRTRGMNKATEVLLTGNSAGGLAAYIHADHVAEMLPQTVRRYKAAPGSGVFLRHANVEGEPVYEQRMMRAFMMQNSSSGVDVHCLVSKSPRYMYLCLFAEEVISHLQTPLFVLNSMYDKWSIRCIQAAEPVQDGSPQNENCSAVPGWYDCAENAACTAEQWRANEQWGADFRDMMSNTRAFSADGNGVFAYSCNLHGAEKNDDAWNKIAINGVTMRQAITNWYYSDGDPASKHTYVDCAISGNYHCNPTCPDQLDY